MVALGGARAFRLILWGALLLLAAPAVSQPTEEGHSWSVNHSQELLTGVDFELFAGARQLGHDPHGEPLRLGWVGNFGGHFRFMPYTGSPNVRDHRRRSFSPDENVALYNTEARRYLRYRRRSNRETELEFAATPAYEWQLRNRSVVGNRVRFFLYNSRAGHYLIAKSMPSGIGLGWFGVSNAPQPQMYSLALSAQVVVQGWIPFTGRFPIIGGVGPAGTLLGVQNPNQSITLGFVKPGWSTTQCSNPNATERLGPGASLTAEQMRTLYGSATPALPINFLACVAAPPGLNVTLLFINLTYRPPN